MYPETYFLKDDGLIPNNKIPLLIYRNAFQERGEDAANRLEKTFESNNWKRAWRNGVFDYHHYHSNTHEVLGVFKGKALLKMGGESGKELEVSAGDVIVIPAGVGHKNLRSENFGVVGAYPGGKEHDLKKGKKEERPEADKNIASVPMPQADPLHGKDSGLRKIWKDYY